MAVTPFRRLVVCSLFTLLAGLGGSPVGGRAELTAAGKEFSPRSAAAGSTLFTVLPAEQTGLKEINAYDDPAMWAARYREFSLGAIGTGVAIGDYDGDGRPDIFVVAKTGNSRLYRNLGGFRFEDVSLPVGIPPAPGKWQQGAAFADVNNDGWLDLYVCRFNAPNLLYINQGNGTFIEEAAARGLALVDASSMAAFCDYDRDGWLDVYVQTNLLDADRHPNGQRDRLYRNNGNGTFTDVTDRAGITGETQGHAATWWDFDEDGWPDLYVDNDFRDPDQFYHNNGDGTFTNVLSWVLPHTPHSSMGADLGDLNNDGHSDLLVADMAATSRIKDHRGMAKLRSGLTDNEQNPAAAPQLMRNALFLGTGTTRLMEGAQLAGLGATDWTWSVRFEDLDLDGRLDVQVTNGMVRELHNLDLTQRMMTRESLAERVRISRSSPVLAEQNLVFRNEGDLQFTDVSHAWGLDQVGVSFGAAFGDLDGDGDLDLVVANMDGVPTVARNDVASGHVLALDLRGVASNRFGIGAVVRIETAQGRQMRTLTLARGYLSTSEPFVHFGLGDETLVRRVTIEWPGGARQTLENLSADRRYTVTEPPERAPPPRIPRPLLVDATRQSRLDIMAREKPFDEWERQPLLPFRLNRPGPSVATGDFDGDGLDDLAVGGLGGQGGKLYGNLGGGEFLLYGAAYFPDTTVPDGPIVPLDVDADGDLDLLVTRAGTAATAGDATYQPRVLRNDGHGQFAAAPEVLPAFPVSVGAAVAGDFERSGRPGIFLGGRSVPGRYPQTPRSALLAWRDGRYVDVTAEVAPALATIGLVTAALWSDADNDGWLDLLVACEWGPVKCFRNREGKSLEDVSERWGFAAAGNGWWRALATGDFNGDGRMDYVAGNTGLNTRYHASAAEPALLYALPAAGAAPPQLVEAESVGGVYFPLRDRETLARLMPAALRPFPTADAYSKAPFDAVFPPAAREGAVRLAVSELRNGIFLSQPDGTWRFSAFPRLAQIAPFQAFHVGDLDGDGRLDVLALGNAFTPTPETGRFDGGIGWLLRGDGRGGFAIVPANESGFVAGGDGRALVATDFDRNGRPDFLALRNNDRALYFQNQGRGGSGSFRVVLKGPPGNPTAIGAQLTLQLRDGATQRVESAGPVFFGYAEGNPPVRLQVRWPDARISERTFSEFPSKQITLSPP